MHARPPSFLHAEALFSTFKAIVVSSDGHNLVTGGDNGVVEVWQACDFKQLYVYPGCDAGIRAMDLSHDQRSEHSVCTCTIGSRLKVLHLKPLTQIPIFTLIAWELQYIQTEMLLHYYGLMRK